MSKKPDEVILPTEISDEIETETSDENPTPKKQAKPQNLKVEVSTEKLEKVFNDGFAQLGKLLKPETPKPIETPPPPKDEPKKREYQFGDEFDPFLDAGV